VRLTRICVPVVLIDGAFLGAQELLVDNFFESDHFGGGLCVFRCERKCASKGLVLREWYSDVGETMDDGNDAVPDAMVVDFCEL
jgi:hypothetical protein